MYPELVRGEIKSEIKLEIWRNKIEIVSNWNESMMSMLLKIRYSDEKQEGVRKRKKKEKRKKRQVDNNN